MTALKTRIDNFNRTTKIAKANADTYAKRAKTAQQLAVAYQDPFDALVLAIDLKRLHKDERALTVDISHFNHNDDRKFYFMVANIDGTNMSLDTIHLGLDTKTAFERCEEVPV